MVWNNGESGSGERYHHKAIASAVRSRDPYQETVKGWVLRRLSPDSNPIELDGLPKVRDEHTLLRALGEEAANWHLGSKKQPQTDGAGAGKGMERISLNAGQR